MSKIRSEQVQRYGIILLFVVGLLLGFFSLAADSLGLDITPGFGIIQMLLFLLALSCFTLGLFWLLYRIRPNNAPRSLQADIGIRLALTGLVFAYVAGFADVVTIGTHIQPRFERPFVGPLQLGGLVLGILSIGLGLFLYHTSRGARKTSSMEFIVNGNSNNNPPVASQESVSS